MPRGVINDDDPVVGAGKMRKIEKLNRIEWNERINKSFRGGLFGRIRRRNNRRYNRCHRRRRRRRYTEASAI